MKTLAEEQHELVNAAIRLGEKKAIIKIMNYIKDYMEETNDKDRE